VFSRTSSQDVKSRAKAGAAQAKAGAAQAKAAAAQAKAQATLLQGRALQAKEQFTPLAKSAQLTASQGVQQARSWAAPRVEQAGIAVQDSIAPKVSSAMIATARRMQPVSARRRRRWPAILAGVVTVSAAAVAVILLRGQRANRLSAEPAADEAPPPVPPASDRANSDERSETAQADVNGQVRTP
jgi:hypothetical protein